MGWEFSSSWVLTSPAAWLTLHRGHDFQYSNEKKSPWSSNAGVRPGADWACSLAGALLCKESVHSHCEFCEPSNESQLAARSCPGAQVLVPKVPDCLISRLRGFVLLNLKEKGLHVSSSETASCWVGALSLSSPGGRKISRSLFHALRGPRVFL